MKETTHNKADTSWLSSNGSLDQANWPIVRSVTALEEHVEMLGMEQEGISGMMEMFCLISLINTDWRTHLRSEWLTVCKLYLNFQKADVGSIVWVFFFLLFPELCLFSSSAVLYRDQVSPKSHTQTKGINSITLAALCACPMAFHLGWTYFR